MKSWRIIVHPKWCHVLFTYSFKLEDFTSTKSTSIKTIDNTSLLSSLLALNGGGRFLSPSSPLSSMLCSLVSWETLSALLSKLKYYGLTGLLMQLTLSKLGFRGTWLPWRNVRSRLYDGAWDSGGQSTQIKYLSKSTDTYSKILLQ